MKGRKIRAGPGAATPSKSAPLLRLIGGSAFIFSSRVAGAALTFATQVVLARWMGAAELGAYVIAFSWCILLSTVATAGMPVAAVRFIGAGLARNDTSYIRGFTRRGTQIALAGGLVIAALGSAILVLTNDVPAIYRTPLLVALAMVPLFAVLNFYAGAANSFPWLAQSFLPTNVLRPLFFLVAIWLFAYETRQIDAYRVMQIQWLVIATLSAFCTLAFQWRLHSEVSADGRRYESRRWLRTAVPLLGVTIFSSYLPEITIVLAGFWLSNADVAVLQVGYRIALIIGFGLYAVDAYTAPEAARMIATTDHASLQRMVNRATRLRFWGALAAVALLAVAGRPLLGLFGQEFVSGYGVLMILATAQLTQAAVGPVARLMALSGHHDRCLVASVGSLLVLIPLMALLAPRFGMTGAAIAAVIGMALWSLWMRYLIVASLGIRPSVL
jgi:O-antigen/teichoic acid export membrane protein